MGLKRKTNLGKIYGKFLVKLIIEILLLEIFIVSVFGGLLLINFIRPANYGMFFFESITEKLKNPETDSDIIPELSSCYFKYVIYDNDFNVIETDLKNKELKNAMSYAKYKVNSRIRTSYTIIPRSDNNILLQYEYVVHYNNETLENFLPSPEFVLVIFMFATVLIISIVQVRKLQRKFQSELEVITKITYEVSNQNLDALIPSSNVKEFDKVLTSFSNMQTALKESINKQKELQRTQKEQIAALAHDIRTPMTVTLGNLDLLSETELNKEQNQYVCDAQDGLEEMSKYISLLTELTVASMHYSYNKKSFSMNELCEEIQKQTTVLCHDKRIIFNMNIPTEKISFCGDKMMIERAFMNVIRNAVEYTSEKGTISFEMSKTDTELIVDIFDSGKGFSEEMINHGTKLFYMEDKSRNSDHYGVGLYFVKTVVENHGGQLELGNSDELGGAKVMMKFSL